MKALIEVELLDHMGNDLTVVNAARVSMAKRHETFEDGDQRLLNYLARHGHWTPFAHPQLTFRIKAPIFVARQLFKHKVGLTENEISRRYVTENIEFFTPTSWREAPEVNIKQGSGGDLDPTSQINVTYAVKKLYFYAKQVYDELIAAGVAPEQARMVLPQSTLTEWIWTGSLQAMWRVCQLRLDPHAQFETQQIAKQIDNQIRLLFPACYKALSENT